MVREHCAPRYVFEGVGDNGSYFLSLTLFMLSEEHSVVCFICLTYKD